MSNDAGEIIGTETSERTAKPLKVRLCAMMFLQYFVQGAYLPVISAYLQDGLGFSADQIGIFGSALAVGPLIAPFIVGQLVDRHLSTERVVAFCHLAGGVLMLILYTQRAPTAIIVLAAIYSALYVPTMMLTNSLTFHQLKNREREFPLIRLWGTIGFIVPAWLVEMVFLKGLEGDALNSGRGIILAVSGVAGLVMGVYSLTLPHTPPTRDAGAKLAPAKVIEMLRFRYFLILVLASFVVAIAHKFFFVWNSPFLTAALLKGGVKEAWEQRISSIGQIFEIAVMAVLGLSILRFGFKWTMAAGALAYVLRCLIFAWAYTLEVDQFPLMMTAICIGQALHGFCFGCFLAAAFMYVDRIAPKDVRGSMQTLYGTFVIGVGMFLGGFVSGRIGGVFTNDAGIRDWSSIWLCGALLAAVAFVGFVSFFPKETSAEAE